MEKLNCIEYPKKAVQTAIDVLSINGIVAVPTETVYGLICLPNEIAIEKLIKLKGRPEDKPFALFVSSLERAKEESIIVKQDGEKLAQKFWPGALTIVVEAKDECVYQYKGSIGLRCPDYLLILDILEQSNGILVNTSMNKSGNSPVWSLSQADEIIEEVDLLLDGGDLAKQKPSTVVDCRSDQVRILRDGAISQQQIEGALRK